MAGTGIIRLGLIVANVVVSYKGFSNRAFFDRYKFEVNKTFLNKDYIRLVTSGFLHVGWAHLIINMISFYVFSDFIEGYLGEFKLLIIYFTGLICGNLFSLLVHRRHGDFSAVGASGAVCCLIFASIALFPGFGVGFFWLPFSVPGWLYGILFVFYSIYGVKSRKDNIGHEAHLSGVIVGLLTAVIMQPSALTENYVVILFIAIPSIILTYLIITKPGKLLIDNLFYNAHKDYYSVDHKYNAEKSRKQNELDGILDKIHKKGIGSLTKKEKQTLKEYSEKLQ